MEFDYLCGKGARAEVYRKGDFIYKIFEPDYSRTAAFYEAFINVIVYETGLPVPKTYELVEIEGRLALRQDFVCGKAFFDVLKAEPSRAFELVEQSVNLQYEMNQKEGNVPLSFKKRLLDSITASQKLSQSAKEKAITNIEKLPDGDRLCHGDFHGFNIIVSGDKYTIIDLPNCSYGCVQCDCARTYMIYAIYAKEIAELYLGLYCKAAAITRESVLEWLPVICAARLSENIAGEEEQLLKWAGELVTEP